METYSDYRLVNASDNEFVSKPQNSNNLMSYGALTDRVCYYDYVLIYNEKTGQGFSVATGCESKFSTPSFKSAIELK